MADGAAQDSNRSYRVLARKYRPSTFDDLIGQDAMVRTISNGFETGRIPQAWMLTGVRGVGKTTTARILARGLNYDTGEGEGRPTIVMPRFGVHCEPIIEGRHVDVLEMDAASHTGISDIREITEAARYKPMSARYKVTIIDEVHMLSNAAFNGLLKTLEEPPEHVKFVFATTEIRKVPVTVLSRCQRFDLRRIETDQLIAHLGRIAEAESVALSADAAALIARAAEGSVRDALSLFDQAIASGHGTVTAEVVQSMLGLVDRLRVFDLLEAILRGDAAAALGLFDAQHRDGAASATVVSELAEAVHAVTRAKVAPGIGKDAGPQAETERVAELAGKLPLRVLTRAWQMLLKGLAEVQGAPRPSAAAEMLIVRLCHVAELPSPDELIRRIETGASAAPSAPPPPVRPTGGGAPAASAAMRVVADNPAPAPAPSAPPVARAQSEVHLARFEDLVALAQAKRDIPLKIALERNVHLVRYERGRIDLRLAEGANSGLVAELQKKLGDWTQERWMVVLSQEEGQPTLYAEAEARRASLVDDVRADPAVAAVLARFPGAEIVDVRVSRPDPAADAIAPPPEAGDEDA